MPAPLTPIVSADELDRFLDASAAQPAVLFKHSRTCGTSAQAYDELLDHLETDGGAGARYGVITVQTHRDLAHAVATKLGVRHESPQALVVRNGRVVWAGSHFRVTASAIAAAVARASAPDAAPAPAPPATRR